MLFVPTAIVKERMKEKIIKHNINKNVDPYIFL